jgi:hypothetical protein
MRHGDVPATGAGMPVGMNGVVCAEIKPDFFLFFSVEMGDVHNLCPSQFCCKSETLSPALLYFWL